MRGFTAEELAEMAAADAEIEDDFAITPDEIRLSRRLDRDAIDQRKPNAESARSAYEREYYQSNKERIAESRREYYQANKARIAEQQREYRQANKERIDERHREYYQANKARIAEQQREYRQANKERIAAQRRRKREENKK